MNRISMAACTLLLFWQASALALGLGSPQLHSQLGEKLDADIPLIGMGSLVADDIHVSIAGPDVYKQLGVDYQASHASMKLTIKEDNNHSPKVFITTSQSVNEPYLHFVLEVTYPGGKVFKDISLLLDAPRQ